MKIKYVVNLRLPTEKAHGYQIGKMCETLSSLGHEVTLIYPRRKNKITEDLFNFYGLKQNFTIVSLPLYDWFKPWLPAKLAYYWMSFLFLLALNKLSYDRDEVVISRNPEVIWYFSRRGLRSYYDAHNWPRRYSPLLRWLLSLSSGVIANSVGTAAHAAQYGVTKALAAPNGVELNDFIGREKQVEELRQRHRLEGKTILAYAGHFYNWKGVDTLIAAMHLLPSDQFACLLVGDGPQALETNIITIGSVPHYEVAAYLLAADILVLPTAPLTTEAELFTSPLKLFEYLAAGRAVVASDLTSSKTIVSEKEARFFKAGDAHDLAKVIKQLASDKSLQQKLGMAGRELARRYTWDKRAEKIIDFINHA